MAVIVKYIVVRNGVEKMTFATKKEADAYDKMLDIAEDLYEYIETAGLDIKDDVLEDLTLFLAGNKDRVMSLLKGIKPKPASGPVKEERSEKAANPKEKTSKK